MYDRNKMKSIFDWEIPVEKMIERAQKEFGVDFKTAKEWCINYVMTA